MNGKLARRSSLFLLELMISILLFSLASAWCSRLFVTARSINRENEELSRMQNLAAGYAELFLASEDFEAFLVEEGAEKVESNGILYHFWYDRDWNICGGEEAAVCLEAVITRDGDFEKCSFSYGKVGSGELIYLLDVEKYTKREVSS